MSPEALLVEDDLLQLAGLAELVARQGFRTRIATSLDSARAILAERAPAVVLSDLQLPDGEGTELLDDIDPGSATRLVLVTGHASIESAVEALRKGAVDYLTKPVDASRLRAVLQRVVERAQPGGAPARAHFGRLVGEAPPMQRVYAEIARVAPTDATVLILGESGTGKDLAAQTIHEVSRRTGRPFLALNCGAMSCTLIESELFGHERDSFTGAVQRHLGYFERASGGTLFLDEITEMPLELQARLLRVIETGALLRLGGETVLHTDVRIVAATNQPAWQAVRNGRLRQDLYYRLNVFPIQLPPLRRRAGDVALLAAHFLAVMNATEGTDKHLPADVVSALERYEWPGNVRQLKNLVQRAFILAGDDPQVRCLPGNEPATPPALETTIVVGSSLEDLKRRVILETLAHYGNRRKAAAALGISLKTLYNRLNLYRRGRDVGSAAEE